MPTFRERLSLWRAAYSRWLHPAYEESVMPEEPEPRPAPKPRLDIPPAPALNTDSSAAPSTWGTKPPPGSNVPGTAAEPAKTLRPRRPTPLPDEED